MNYFFGIKSQEIKTRLLIPRFQNKNILNEDQSLFEVKIVNNKWDFVEINQLKINDNFYLINDSFINNTTIYCLAKKNEVEMMKKSNSSKLKNLNNFTDTSPAFRANLEVSIKNGGFSSYQSEYPFSMIQKKGNILSSINSLCNLVADENFLFFRNIYELPIHEEFEILIINIKNKKIIKKFKAFTNMTNKIIISKEFIAPNIYLFSKSYIGIPIYMSIQNNHISLEHTHPPHEYILSSDRYKTISKKKKNINDFVS
jgi:hypothetical protein